MNTHTPTPWAVETDTVMIWGKCDPDVAGDGMYGYPVAECCIRLGHASPLCRTANHAEAAANAAFIVRAVNSHDEAIEWIRATLNMVDGDGRPPNWDGMRDFLKRAAS